MELKLSRIAKLFDLGHGQITKAQLFLVLTLHKWEINDAVIKSRSPGACRGSLPLNPSVVEANVTAFVALRHLQPLRLPYA